MSSPRTRGRSISGPENVRRPPPPLPPAELPGPVPGPASPFARYGPEADAMVESAEENRRQSLGVLAIVGGLGFAALSAVVVAGVMVVSWLAWRQSHHDSELASSDPTDVQHVRDTGSAGPIPVPVLDPVIRRGKGVSPAPEAPKGPQPGPVTLIVPTEMMFLSIEVGCPGGFRKRGSFRADTSTTKRATVADVPSHERCTVTFQGSEPARTWISGNETKTCTFNPVTCHLVH